MARRNNQYLPRLNIFAWILIPPVQNLKYGCFPNQLFLYFFGKGFKVTGIDFSEEMIKFSREKVSGAEFFVKDIFEPLNFDVMFDGVFAQAVLLHVPKKEVLGVIKNIITPLKPDGYFYVAVKQATPGEPDEQIIKESDYGFEYERFFSLFTLEEMENYLKQVGMEIVYKDIVSSGKTNWIQLIAKK